MGCDLEPAKLPAAIVTFLIGVTSFAAMGMAVAGVCKSAERASAVANAIILPMAFISDVFIPWRTRRGASRCSATCSR